MKLVRFLGGLGNQMFQYAFYKALKKKHPKVLADLTLFEEYPLHNGFEMTDIFDIHLNQASSFLVDLYYDPDRKWILRKLRRVLGLRNTYLEESNPFSFDPTFLEDPSPRLYYGYWQNQGYFNDLDLRKDFRFKKEFSAQNQSTSEKIKQTESISIHVRRGDYIDHPLLGNICDLDYYAEAIAMVQAKINAPAYFIFSNDIPWCQENLPIENATFINWNQGKNSYVDMQLMSLCKHQIIANSSFSWWGAWLNDNPDKIVIAPKKWVNDQKSETCEIIPNTWTSI